MHANDDSEFPENYSQLNWCIKRSILDPIRLAAMEWHIAPRIVPTEEEGRRIGLDTNWRQYLDQESLDVIAGVSTGRGDCMGAT